jgi:hypothetical protein
MRIKGRVVALVAICVTEKKRDSVYGFTSGLKIGGEGSRKKGG